MLYYFELSKDKKPSGKTIPAKQKLDYITRTGKYKNLNAEEHLNHDKFHDGGIISSPTKNEKIPPEEIMLYDSPYGKIKQDENGNICVSKDASIETIDIALSVAKNIFGDELHLSGPKKFIASAIISSKEMDLPIRFDDEMANSILEREKEEERHEREQDNTKFFGGRGFKKKSKKSKAVAITNRHA